MKRKWMYIFLAAMMFLGGCQGIFNGDHTSGNRLKAKVIKVIDGDTMKILVNGKEETIRLLLVDTPESVHPEKPVQPFALEASDYAKEMLSNQNVEIELDVRERDKYGRLLVYLYINGQMFNEMLLENGLARVAYIFEPNTKYVDRFLDIQKKAQAKKIGIWSIENYVDEKGFNEKMADSQQTEDCYIKGNINSKGEKIYHMPDDRDYKKTKAERMFCTEQEAQSAGFRRAAQ